MFFVSSFEAVCRLLSYRSVLSSAYCLYVRASWCRISSFRKCTLSVHMALMKGGELNRRSLPEGIVPSVTRRLLFSHLNCSKFASHAKFINCEFVAFSGENLEPITDERAHRVLHRVNLLNTIRNQVCTYSSLCLRVVLGKTIVPYARP